MNLKPLIVSVGCPCGVGPELAVQAAARSLVPLILVGDRTQLHEIAHAKSIDLSHVEIVQPTPSLALENRLAGKPTRASGAAQLIWIDAALELVTSGRGRALVTGPVNKDAIATSAIPASEGFKGHTEHLQKRLRTPEVVMAFWSPNFTTSLVTTHLPISAVPSAIHAENVASSTFWLGSFLHQLDDHSDSVARQLVVCGLNPHAGENGLLGTEEQTVISVGVNLARARLAAAGIATNVVGPMGAETAFRLANRGQFHGVVAMYHDQATIPMKLLGFGEAVNVSLGLPIVRTSVDHGTGYDQAGKGTADPSGLNQAIWLAHRMTVNRENYEESV